MIAFFGGMLLIAIIDKLIPSEDNPHEMPHIDGLDNEGTYERTEENQEQKLMRKEVKDRVI